MNTSSIFHKNTLLFIAIFLIGVLIAILYINAAFATTPNSTTAIPASTETVAYNS